MVKSMVICAITLAAIGFEAVLTQVTKRPPDPVKTATGLLDFHYCHCILDEKEDMDAHGECLDATRKLAEACHSKKQLDKTCKREFDRLFEVCIGRECASRENCERMAGTVDRTLQDKGIIDQPYIGIYYAPTTTLEPTTKPTTTKLKPTPKLRTTTLKPTTTPKPVKTRKPMPTTRTVKATTVTDAFTTTEEPNETPRLVELKDDVFLLIKKPEGLGPADLDSVSVKVHPVDAKDDEADELSFTIVDVGDREVPQAMYGEICPEELYSDSLLCLPLQKELSRDKAYIIEATPTTKGGKESSVDKQLIIPSLEIGREKPDGWLRIVKDTEAGKTYAVWPKEPAQNGKDNRFRLTIAQWPSIEHGPGRVIVVEGGREKFKCPTKGLDNRPDDLCHYEPGLLTNVKHTAYLTVLNDKKQPLKTYKIDFSLDALEVLVPWHSQQKEPIPTTQTLTVEDKEYSENITEMGRIICDCITDFAPDRHNRPYCIEGVQHFITKCKRNQQLKACHKEYDGFFRQCNRGGICREAICIEIGEKHEFIPYRVVVP